MEEKKISTKVLLKSGFWYTVSNFLPRAMVFITMPIFTRLLTKAEYGDFSVFTNWQQVLLIICGLEVYSTLNRARLDFTEKKEQDSYITSSLLLSTMFTGVVFALYLIFPSMFDRWFLLDRKYMMIMFGYMFTYPALCMFQVKQRIEYRYKLSSGISLGVTVLSSLLSLGLVLAFDSDRLLWRILGQFALVILTGLFFYIYFITVNHSVSLKYWKYALRIGLPMVFSYLASRVLLAADTIVLKHMCTAEEVSYLSVAHSVSHTILLLVQAVNMAWAPWFYDMLKAGRYSVIKKAYSVYLWGTVFFTFCVLMVGPELVMVLGGTKYRDSIYLLPPYILCGVFTVLTAQFGNLETYYKKPEYAAILTGIAAVLNVGLDILGVRLWDYRAVCYATVFCQILLVVLHYLITRKMRIKELLSAGNLTLAICASLLLIPLSLLLYKNNLVRYILIGIIAAAAIVVAVIKRKELLVLIKRFLKKENKKGEMDA